MRHLLRFILLATIAGCGASVPSDQELRLAAKSELRKQNRPEAAQASLDGRPVTDVHCEGSATAKVCDFKIADATFRKAFARTGSGAWSAYDGNVR